MKEIDNIQDRIDEYIRGNMSDKDKVIFEDELRQDADLRHEVEVQVSIADAVQAVHLKQVLQGVEAELVAPKVHRKRIYQWIAVAAAISLFVYFGNMWHQISRMKDFGSEYYAGLVVPSARDGNGIDSLLLDSYTMIGNGQYEEAENALALANEQIEKELSAPIVDAETEYNHILCELKRFDAQWYHAIIVMRQGRYREARRLLTEIAKTDSPYMPVAKEILNRMFNVKL